jgi:translocation and assembly module TamB
MVGGLVVLCFVSVAWYLTSDSFREQIRRQVVSQLERATGGRAEVGRVEWHLAHLRASLQNVTLHGLEAPEDPPLLHIDQIDAQLQIFALLGRGLHFRSLVLHGPAVHLVFYPDGRSNQPAPRVGFSGTRTGLLDDIFDFTVSDFAVQDGVFQINERRIPIALHAKNVAANLGYQTDPGFYSGKVRAGQFDTAWKDFQPFASAVNFDFRLDHNALAISSANISSGKTNITIDGKLTDFVKPQVDARYHAKLDLQQAGTVARMAELKSGILQVEGSARYADGRMTSSGKVQLTDGSWIHPDVHARSVSGTANYELDDNRLQINHILASVLGGSVSGEMTVLHWSVPPREHGVNAPPGAKAAGHTMAAREQEASARFTLRGLQVERIEALFATARLPLSDLHAGGVVDGSVDWKWLGTAADSELRLRVQAVPTASPGAGEIPVNAQLQGVYSFRRRNLQIDHAELHTPASHLTAVGNWGADHLDLAVGASTTNLHEIQPLLDANGAGHLPIQVMGEASFQGVVQGATTLPGVNGHLKLSDFTTIVRASSADVPQSELVKAIHKKGKTNTVRREPTTNENSKAVRFHWDSFDGYVAFAPENASVRGAVLKSGNTRIELGADTSLLRGKFTDSSVFHADLRIQDARVEEMQSLVDVNYPVTGSLNLELKMAGTRQDPRGSGTLTIRDGTAYGEPLESLSTELMFSGREASFRNLRAVSGDAHARGSGSINVSTEEFRFEAQGSGIDLLRFPILQTSKVKLTGLAEIDARGSGTLSAPVFDGHAQIANISLGAKHEGNLDITFATEGQDLHLNATSQFVTAKLTAGGTIRLGDPFISDITVNVGNVDLQPFLVGVARGHSSIDGTLHLTGPLRHPAALNARLEIPRYESKVEGVTLKNSGPIVATYADGTATLVALRLLGDGTDLSASGTARLSDGQELRLRADGQVNLKLLQSFDPEIVSYGRTLVGVRVGGTLREPALRGRISIEHAGISYVDMPNGLSDLNGSLVFNEDRLQVEKLTAHTGGGDLAIGGFIAYGRSVSFNLTATGKDVRIRYPEGVSANGDADLRLAGTLQNATLSGEVVVNKFGLNPRFDFAYYLTRSKQQPTTPNPDSPLNNLHFDVRVVSASDLQLETSLAKITGDVDLRLRGNAFRPVVLGRISIVEGDITFNGTKYRLDRGDVLFTNPTKIEPVLDLEASARVSDYDISIGLHGTSEKLNTTYRSDPPLPTADVFALLAFGRTTDQAYTAPQSSAYTESASSAVLGSALNAAVGSRVQKLFGASRIKIDPEVGGAGNNPNARLTVEQQVSGNITLTYITNLAQSAQQVIQFQYNVNHNVSIVGERDEYGVVGFEVQVRQRKR